MQNMNPSPAAADDLMSYARSRVRRYWIAYTMLVRNATTLSQAVGTWKNMMRAFSSRPGMTGSWYHACGWGDIGSPRPEIMTAVKRTPRTIFRTMGQSFQMNSKSMADATTTTTVYEISS
jgi:hypothetical protein